jgi:ribosome-binding protein aMBF1 (putative translation factor)
MKTLNRFVNENITEANDYKRTRQYNKLTPKMKRAVDMVFTSIDKDADIILNFEKNVNTAAKQYGVSKQDLMNYFDKETLTILRK